MPVLMVVFVCVLLNRADAMLMRPLSTEVRMLDRGGNHPAQQQRRRKQ